MKKIISNCDRSMASNRNFMATLKKALEKVNGTLHLDFSKSNFLAAKKKDDTKSDRDIVRE
jgi:hypothetical protein